MMTDLPNKDPEKLIGNSDEKIFMKFCLDEDG